MRNKKPRHEEIAEIIRERITSGELKPRYRIPSHTEFSVEFNASVRTVSRAIASLRERNFLWTLPHKGSYARPPEHWRKEAQ